MNSKRQLSHDILNALERLRIMHDLVRDKNFAMISETEIEKDLKLTLSKLADDFQQLFKADQ